MLAAFGTDGFLGTFISGFNQRDSIGINDRAVMMWFWFVILVALVVWRRERSCRPVKIADPLGAKARYVSPLRVEKNRP